MATASLSFLLFSIISALIYNVCPYNKLRQIIMLIANLAFLASFSTNIMAFIPFIGFLAIGYAFIHISKSQSAGKTLFLLIATFLVIFCWLKKYWFLSFVEFISSPYATIGLSYIFFRVLALIIDIHQDKSIGSVGLLSYFNFTLNFPTLVAGPIQRYQEFDEKPTPLTLPVIGYAVERIILGFFKVIAISSILSMLQTSSTEQLLGGVEGLQQIKFVMGSIALYPLYLYFNFSGYIDIAIGVGRLFGKTYPENFNSPFSSLNFIEFWSRWHMTLSNWLRDYVYSPLLKFLMQNVKNKSFDPYLGVCAFFITFFIIGIWHGSTIIFAIYGILLALGVSINKLYQIHIAKKMGKKEYKTLSSKPLYKACSRGLTYTWYALCMVCFWATSEQALRIIDVIGVYDIVKHFILVFIIATVMLTITEQIRNTNTKLVSIIGHSVYLRSALMGVLTFLCVAVIMYTQKSSPDNIYQAF